MQVINIFIIINLGLTMTAMTYLSGQENSWYCTEKGTRVEEDAQNRHDNG